MKARIISIALCAFLISCTGSVERNSISFESPFAEISDAIQYINLVSAHLDEVNYYIDDGNVLRSNNKIVGVLNDSFLSPNNLITNEISETDEKLFRAILLLKKNGIDAFFRHRVLAMLVYDYKPTEDNEFEDIRYLVYSEMNDDDFSVRTHTHG